jgi:hypothetical protein
MGFQSGYRLRLKDIAKHCHQLLPTLGHLRLLKDRLLASL